MQKIARCVCLRTWLTCNVNIRRSQPVAPVQPSILCLRSCRTVHTVKFLHKSANLSLSGKTHGESLGAVGFHVKDPPIVTDDESKIKLYTPRPELVQVLEIEEGLSKSEWDALKTTLIDGGRSFAEHNFAGSVMGGCICYKNYILGKSLMEALRKSKKKPDIATLARYLRLCGECYEQSSEEEILKYYKELREAAPVLDAASLEHVICALARTSVWKDCLNLIEELKFCSIPRGVVYNRVAAAAFKHNEVDLGWSLLETLVSLNRPLAADACLQWFSLMEATTSEENTNEMLKRFVDFCARHQLQLPLEITERIRLYLLRKDFDKWQGDYTTIQLNGVCRRCRSTLNSAHINEEEFAVLRDAFMKNVIVGDNPYSKTSPQEISNFKQFISRTSPYDVVIDGLNVAFYDATRKTTSAEKAQMLFDMVHDLVVKKKTRVLVLGRVHMLRWPQQIMSYIKKNTHCFFANNISKDDPFLLYAAMFSGLGTHVVSRDLMRDHKFLLNNPQLSSLFRRWQLCHQLGFIRNLETDKFQFMPPVTYNPVSQRTDNFLHIPCCKLTHAVYNPDLPARWLCMSKVSETE